MRDREPYLHHGVVGKFQDPGGRSMARPGDRWSETFLRRAEEGLLVENIRREQQQQRLGVNERHWVANEWVAQEEQEDEDAGNKGVRSTHQQQVLGSPDKDSHLLFSSEPPDIRNWFSSYVYESPTLDSSEDFGFPDYRKSMVDREEVESETVWKGGENSIVTRKEDDVASENLTSSSFCSILVSEPPDIRNWFSSYVYESPALDTSEDLGFPDYRNSKVDREEIKSRKVLKGGENSIVTSSELLKFDGVVEHNKDKQLFFIHQIDKGVADRESLSVLNGSPSKGIHEATLKGKRVKEQDDHFTEDAEKSGILCAASAQALRRGFSGEAIHRPGGSKEVPFNNAGISPRKLFRRTSPPIRESREAKDQVNVSAQNTSDMSESTSGSSWKTTRSKNKENTRDGSPGNNFVSTRKGRCKTENDENSLERSGGDQPRLLGNGAATSSVDNKDAMVIRKVLTETTNLQHSGLSEITGKWKCPRKNKPDLGPPLKQLRLERWVHRA